MNNNDKIVTAINEFKRSVGDTAISIHGKQYSLVATRLAVARRVLGSSLDLKTQIIHHDDKKVIVQVDAYVDGKHLSTGTSEELRSTSRINQTSALENAETSAVGRALAFLGFANDSVASAEEVSLAIEQLINSNLEGANLYLLSHLQTKVIPFEVMLVCLAALGICFLATLYPAYRASCIQPAHVLRYE